MKSSHWIILTIALITAFALIPHTKTVNQQGHHLLMTTWGMPFEDQLFKEGYAKGFEQLHPDWTVDYQRHPNVMEKYNAWHIHGFGADVMRIGIDHYHQLIAKGMIAPLDEFINDPEIGLTDEEIADYFPAIWKQLQLDGHIYALPSDNAQYGLYYNIDAFDRYNTAHPDDPISYPNAEWTWRDLQYTAQKLEIRDEKGRAKQYGLMFDLWAWPYLTFLKQAGGEMWDDDQTTALINSPEGVKALEFLVSLVPPDAPIRAESLAASAADPAEMFKTGRLAMLLDGSWRAPNIELIAPDLNFAIAPLPHDRRRAVVSGSVLWAVSIHSKEKRTAWQMIKWMTDHEQSLRYWNTLRVAPPARLSVVRSDAFKTTQGIIENDRVLVPAMPRNLYKKRAAWLEYAVTPNPKTGKAPGFVPASPYQADMQDKITTALIAATRGEMSAQQTLDRAVKQIHAIIDRDRAAKGLPPVERK